MHKFTATALAGLFTACCFLLTACSGGNSGTVTGGLSQHQSGTASNSTAIQSGNGSTGSGSLDHTTSKGGSAIGNSSGTSRSSSGTKSNPAGSSVSASSAGSSQNSSRPVPESGSNLHITGNGHNIGDVHPFYNSADKKWYMYYLAQENGNFVPKLLVSADLMNWTPVTLQRSGNKPKQTYYVLGVFNFGGKFFSYYGNGSTMEASTSTNLTTWMNAPFQSIPNDMERFPATSRDPYVFFDSDRKIYRYISSAYVTNQEWNRGQGMNVSLALGSTTGNDLDSWDGTQKELIHFPNGYNGEPECPQMFKIGSRWYVMASLARRSNHYVGLPSYWIGDSNKKIDEVSWSSKQEQKLEGEDLCAAQIAFDGSKYRLWGWIPQSSSGGTWGGHLNLPREVYALGDGTLAVKLDTKTGNAIRGNLLGQSAGATLQNGGDLRMNGTYNRLDLEFGAQIDSSVLSVEIGGFSVRMDREKVSVVRTSDGKSFAAFTFPAGKFNGNAKVRIIAEADMVEVFINDQWSLCARIDTPMSHAGIRFTSQNGSTAVSDCKVFRLKFLEEI